MTAQIPRTARERIVHAVLFEVIALLICTPTLAWLMGKPLFDLGLLTLMFSAIAMVWNMIFNALFERAERRWQLRRTLSVRVLHALLFEVGLIVLLVPLAAWWLSISLLQALLLDIGLILFFLPYTVAFNWLYDLQRARRLAATRLCAGA